MRSILYLIVVLAVAGSIWLLGLSWFVSRMENTVPANALPDADAIIVLTGGSERVEAGLKLLTLGKGKMLFISGVGEGVKLSELLQNASITLPDSIQHEYKDRVVLGRNALDTKGNAQEVTAFASRNKYHRLILVTSNYHMERSLLEFKRVLPDAVLYPFPVMSEHVILEHWWSYPGTRSLILSEYHKFLAVLLGIGFDRGAFETSLEGAGADGKVAP